MAEYRVQTFKPVDIVADRWASSLQIALEKFFSDWKTPVPVAQTLPIWQWAFTSPTFDPDNNYRTMATQGDVVMTMSFQIEIMRRSKGNATPEHLTNLRNNYLYRAKQSLMFQELSMEWLIRTSVPITDATREDVIEAFFQALFVTTGYNVQSVRMMMQWLLDRMENNGTFSISDTGLSARVQVLNVFKARNFGKPAERTWGCDGEYHAELFWSAAAKKYDPTFHGKISEGQGVTYDEALASAYQAALPVAEKANLVAKVARLDRSVWYDLALKKAQSQGYQTLKSQRFDDATVGSYWFLYGVMADTNKCVRLASALVRGKHYHVAYAELLKQYLES